MPTFVIERHIPGLGDLTPAELKAISLKSVGVLREMGPQIQWQHSYVTERTNCTASTWHQTKRRCGSTPGVAASPPTA
jgi:hypothetical protein